MTSASRLSTIRAIYDERAPSYDTTSSFHKEQAADYQSYVNPRPGQRILDLACGTGGLTIPFAQAVQPSGCVIGVDISVASLDIARRKAEDLKLEAQNVVFLEGDIARVGDLDEVKTLAHGGGGDGENGFDVITCASAIVLLDDAGVAIKHWASLLKPGGRLVFDVPTAGSFLVGVLLEKIGREVGVPVPFSRSGLSSREDIVKILSEAGLDASETFLSKVYETEEVWFETANGGAEQEWNKMLTEKRWFQTSYLQELEEKGALQRGKEIFVRELEAMGRERQGRVLQELRLNVGVGRRL